MEDRHIIMDDTLAEHGIVLSAGAQRDLRATGGWGILLSVIGLLYAIIIIFSGIVMLTMFSSFGGGMPADQQGIMNGMAVLMIIGGLIFIVPVVFLLRFSINSLKANSSMKTYILTETISHLKLSFMTYGIMIILFVVLYFIWIAYIGATASGF